MTADERITVGELYAMFGGELPVEAASLIFDSRPDTPIGEVRAKLSKMAADRAARAPAVIREYTLAGFPVVIDDGMPADEVRIISPNGDLLVRIVIAKDSKP